MLQLFKKLFSFTRFRKPKVDTNLYRILRMNRRLVSNRK